MHPQGSLLHVWIWRELSFQRRDKETAWCWNSTFVWCPVQPYLCSVQLLLELITYRQHRSKPQALLNSDGNQLMNLWFIPHITEVCTVGVCYCCNIMCTHTCANIYTHVLWRDICVWWCIIRYAWKCDIPVIQKLRNLCWTLTIPVALLFMVSYTLNVCVFSVCLQCSKTVLFWLMLRFQPERKPQNRLATLRMPPHTHLVYE